MIWLIKSSKRPATSPPKMSSTIPKMPKHPENKQQSLAECLHTSTQNNCSILCYISFKR